MSERPTVLGVKLRRAAKRWDRYCGSLGKLRFGAWKHAGDGHWRAWVAGNGNALHSDGAYLQLHTAVYVLDNALRGLGFAPRKTARRG